MVKKQSDIREKQMKQVYIIGMGPGSRKCLTQQASEAIEHADVIIGSKRLLEAYSNTDKKLFFAVTARDIYDIINKEKALIYAVLMSGDTGFYSGTKKLTEQLYKAQEESVVKKYDINILPGISSVIYLASKIGQPWEMAAMVSLHGKKQNYIPLVLTNEWTYFLTQGDVSHICNRLCESGLGGADIWIGENMSYDNEKILSGHVSEYAEYTAAGLTVMAVHNHYPKAAVMTGLPDESFIRADIPMTKREIRASVVSRLSPAKDAIVYDIGAGTGSVSVELAMHALYGTVYAVERTKEGCELIAQNARKFGLDNIDIINASAADVIEKLPAADSVFIGGSGGELEKIMDIVLKKNPGVHIVITAVTLETLNDSVRLMEDKKVDVIDIVQIAVTQIKKRGRYHMLAANNPVFIIEGRGNR